MWTMRIFDAKLPVALSFCLTIATGLGLGLGLTGCPAQSACPPCFVGGVMAPGSQPNPSPDATVNLQLSRDAAREGAVSEVHVTLKDANGNSETVTYDSSKVGTLDSSSMLTLRDNDVYSVDDQAPKTANVEIVFVNGTRMSQDIRLKTE